MWILDVTNLNVVSTELYGRWSNATWTCSNDDISSAFCLTSASNDLVCRLPFCWQQTVNSTDVEACNKQHFTLVLRVDQAFLNLSIVLSLLDHYNKTHFHGSSFRLSSPCMPVKLDIVDIGICPCVSLCNNWNTMDQQVTKLHCESKKNTQQNVFVISFTKRGRFW